MIQVKARRRGGQYISFLSQGHAGFDEEGLDIVCAAVSAFVINTGNSIERFTSDVLLVEERDGFVSFLFPHGHSRDTKLLMDSLMLGLCGIEETYGKEYIRVSQRDD